MVMYLNVFLKIGVLLTSSRVWTSGFGDVMLFWTNLDLKDETFGRFIKGELGVALKGAEGAPLFQSWLHFAGPFSHNAIPQVSIQDVQAVSSTSEEWGSVRPGWLGAG